MNEQDRLAMEQDNAPEVGHTLIINNPTDPLNPRVFHNVKSITSFSDRLEMLRAGDTYHTTTSLHKKDVVTFLKLSSERTVATHPFADFQVREFQESIGQAPQMPSGVEPDDCLETCLSAYSHAEGCPNLLAADGPQCPPECLNALSHAEGCKYYIDPDVHDEDVPY